jgi:hypothetical protein
VSEIEDKILGEAVVAPTTEARVLDERALASPYADEAPPPGPPLWVETSVSVVSSRLSGWSELYARLETVQQDAVVMVPTLASGWIKVVKGATPTTSRFYVHPDSPLLAEPGSAKWIVETAMATAAADPLDRVHLVLDVAGMAPIIGEPADALNTVLYFIQGDTANGALSAVAMIPIGGEAATLTKWSVRYGDELVDFGSRRFLRDTLGLVGEVEAHHLVPWELRYHEIVQAAGRAGFGMNDALNGIPVTRLQITKMPLEADLAAVAKEALDEVVTVEIQSGVHAVHPALNFYVVKRLEEFTASLGEGAAIDPLLARQFLESELILELEGHVATCLGRDTPLNAYFKELLKGRGWYTTYKDYGSDATFYQFIYGSSELINEINVFGYRVRGR